MILAIKILVTIGFVIFTAKLDAEHLNKKQYFKSHVSRWIQRVLFISGLALSGWTDAIAMGLIFWVLFDHTLNLFRENIKLFYVGKTSEMDMFWHHNRLFYYSAKFVALFAAILILIYA